MTPEEIVAKAAHSLNNFKLIVGQPSESDLTRLREAFAPLLLQIPYDETGAVHNLIGLIRPEDAYVARYGEAFPEPTRVWEYEKKLTTTLWPSSARALNRRTKRSARTARHTRQRDGRRHISSFPSSLIPGSENFETPKPFTPRLPRRTSYHTSKQGALASTPSTSWRCIMKCSAITSRSRESPSILIFSRTPRGKPAEQGEKIADETLLLFATTVMLKTERFTRANGDR